MELESVKQFAEKQTALTRETADYQAGETGYEDLTPKERFDGLWDRLDELAAQSPWYDGLNRTVISLRDLQDIDLTITRSLGEPTKPLHYGEASRTPRYIRADWSCRSARRIVTEEHSDEDLAHNSRVSNSLSRLEETEMAARKIIEDVTAVLSRPSMMGDGHP